MSARSLPIPDWELSAHWEGAPQAVQSEAAAPRHLRRWVQFVHADRPVCLPLESVERVVPKLGRLVPLAGAPHLAGIALINGQPLPVVDLEEAGTPPESRPALVMQAFGGRIALCVRGPADLIEAVLEPGDGQRVGSFASQGQVDGRVSLLSMESVSAWLKTRLELEE